MEQKDTQKITFDRLPEVVGQLLSKVDYIIDKLDNGVVGDARSANDQHCIMTLDEVCRMIGKRQSTVYALTSARKIPFHKRGKKLYFFKDELIRWIESGGAVDIQPLMKDNDATFEEHLNSLRQKKTRKPSSISDKAY